MIIYVMERKSEMWRKRRGEIGRERNSKIVRERVHVVTSYNFVSECMFLCACQPERKQVSQND